MNEMGIALPTVRPEVLMTHTFEDESLEAIESARDHIIFLINFQPPWTKKQIDEALKRLDDHGLKYKYIRHREYNKKNGVPIARIREDAAAIDKSLPFYMFGDDDCFYRGGTTENNKFDYGGQILQVIYYMMKFPKCGFVQFGSSLFKKYPAGTIGPISVKTDSANSPVGAASGLALKNNQFFVKGCETVFSPPGSLSYLNWGEEAAACAYRYYNGLFFAKLGGARCDHGIFSNKDYDTKKKKDTTNRPDELMVEPGWSRYHWNKVNFDKSIYMYIREHICSDVTVTKDNGIVNYYNFEKYKENRGIQDDKLMSGSYEVDFNNYTTSQLSSYINRMSSAKTNESYSSLRALLNYLKRR